jgi:hypothetical protein
MLRECADIMKPPDGPAARRVATKTLLLPLKKVAKDTRGNNCNNSPDEVVECLGEVLRIGLE